MSLMNVRSLAVALLCAAASLTGMTSDPGEQKATEALEQALGSKNPETRKPAAVAMSLAGVNYALEARLEALLDDKDFEVKLAAIASLSDVHNQRAKDALVPAMTDTTPEVSFAAAKALWGLKEATGRGALRMLRTPRATFTTALREGVGFVPVPGLGEGISSMQSLLGDPGLSGRASAALLLGADPNTQTLAALKDALHDKTWSVRAAAAHSLALHNDPALKADLAPLLEDPNEAVRLRAAAGYLRLRAVEQQPKPAPARGKALPGRDRKGAVR